MFKINYPKLNMMFYCTFHFYRRVWDHWLAQLAFKNKLKDMDHVALQFWAKSLMAKVQEKKKLA